MIYRALGATGLQVSVVGLGTWQLGGEWGRTFSERDARLIVDAARQQGITLIDTAECYGDHLSERLVGEAIRADRGRWVVATKFGHRYTTPFEREQAWSAALVQAQLEGSLRALGVDRIDLYQFHSGGRAAFDDEELWRMLARQKEAGTIHHLGVSVSSSQPAAEQVYQVRRAREVGAECIQLVYNRLQREPEAEMLPACDKADLGVLARVPLASGFLGGKYRPGSTFASSDIRSRRTAEEIARLAEEAQAVQRSEVPPGVPMAAWALAWCLRSPTVTAVIPGCKDAAQVKQNAAAADLLGSA